MSNYSIRNTWYSTGTSHAEFCNTAQSLNENVRVIEAVDPSKLVLFFLQDVGREEALASALSLTSVRSFAKDKVFDGGRIISFRRTSHDIDLMRESFEGGRIIAGVQDPDDGKMLLCYMGNQALAELGACVGLTGKFIESGSFFAPAAIMDSFFIKYATSASNTLDFVILAGTDKSGRVVSKLISVKKHGEKIGAYKDVSMAVDDALKENEGARVLEYYIDHRDAWEHVHIDGSIGVMISGGVDNADVECYATAHFGVEDMFAVLEKQPGVVCASSVRKVISDISSLPAQGDKLISTISKVGGKVLLGLDRMEHLSSIIAAAKCSSLVEELRVLFSALLEYPELSEDRMMRIRRVLGKAIFSMHRRVQKSAA